MPLRKALFLLALLIFALTACTGTAPAPAAETPAPVAVPTDSGFPTPTEVVATPTPEPTPTPEQARLVLLAPPEADATLAGQMESWLTEWAGEAGLAFERVTTLTAEELSATRLVVALPQAPGLAELAAAAPETQFLAVGDHGLTAGSNLSTISAGGARPDQAAFLAGYLAAVLTPQWRIGAILPPGDSGAALAFRNGVVYYCGLCRPAYPPFVQYPLTVELPAGAAQADAQAVADSLIAQGVTTVYVAPGLADATLYEYLAQAGLSIIGGETPPPGAQNRWAASLRSDLEPALQDLVARLLAGEGGQALEAPLALSEINENLLSTGKQRVIEEMLQDLAAGYIRTGAEG